MLAHRHLLILHDVMSLIASRGIHWCWEFYSWKKYSESSRRCLGTSRNLSCSKFRHQPALAVPLWSKLWSSLSLLGRSLWRSSFLWPHSQLWIGSMPHMSLLRLQLVWTRIYSMIFPEGVLLHLLLLLLSQLSPL